jgi:hypothetical protein
MNRILRDWSAVGPEHADIHEIPLDGLYAQRWHLSMKFAQNWRNPQDLK